MKLTAQVKLLPMPEQAQALRDTLQRANEVCNRLSAWAWDHKAFGKFAHRRLRGKLQKKGTKAAKRRLRRLSGKERPLPVG